jgi:transporter family-2 protein
MSPSGLAAVFALCTGFAGAVQVAVQGRLGGRVGGIEAVVINAAVMLVVAAAVLLVLRRGVGESGQVAGAPRWQLLGGVMGAFIVLGVTVAGPRIGIVATTSLLIAGQLSFATTIDHFGWFGVERAALAWPRLLGIVLLGIGAALTLKR